MRKTAIVTGSSGLIGSAAVKFLIEKGYRVIGIDNNMREYFFGPSASTKENKRRLEEKYKENFESHSIDIRNSREINELFENQKAFQVDVDMIVHTAAQPSHDWAAKEPLTDFSVNATGTLNLLEATRMYFPKATFAFTSTNKVYGDRPNKSHEEKRADASYKNLFIKEEKTRYEGYFQMPFTKEHINYNKLASIDESMSIDQSKHSIFGASKVAADIMVQEYGRYFNMNTLVLRGGCLTGPDHAGAELHGFLSYLGKCIAFDLPYTIFGAKGKQVRDNIHSYDLINMIWHYHKNPKPNAVYNAGGGRENSTSILEAIESFNMLRVAEGLPKWDNYTISEEARIGDHIWWISDTSKFSKDYPDWPGASISLKETMAEIYNQYASQRKTEAV